MTGSVERRGIRTWLGLGTALTLCVMVAACGGTTMEPEEPESAQTPPPVPAVSTLPLAVSTNAVMVAMVDHASHAIWDAGGTPPSNDEEWAQLDYHAIQVAASGALVSMGGTGPADEGWARLPLWQQFSQQLADAGLRARQAVESRDLDELEASGNDLIASCEGCHAEYKPDSPTEGVLHMPEYLH